MTGYVREEKQGRHPNSLPMPRRQALKIRNLLVFTGKTMSSLRLWVSLTQRNKTPPKILVQF